MEEEIKLRPLVQKYLPKFIAYVKHYGSETVRECLVKGRSGKIKLTFFTNKKDRHQMMQMLDL